jgi:HD-like signal output (HDOD) protein
MNLEDLLDSKTALPSVPRVLAQVMFELNQEEPELRVISTAINTDIGMTTRLLCLANSAQFALSSKVGNVSQALAVLGFDQVRQLTAAAAVTGAFKAVPGLELSAFWRYSLDVAKLARKLARSVRANPSLAFTSGLLHAVGELVMHQGMPDQMRWLNERVEPLAMRRSQAEIHLLGYCYADAGAGFARLWDFPVEIVDAIGQQNAPFDNEVCEPLAGLVHLCAWRARARAAGLEGGLLVDSFPDHVALVLGVDVDEVLQQEPIDWTLLKEAQSML